jgi:hypothetical protein
VKDPIKCEGGEKLNANELFILPTVATYLLLWKIALHRPSLGLGAAANRD